MISITPSVWLIAFSMFMFLSLALVKRCSELQALEAEKKNKNNREGLYGI